MMAGAGFNTSPYPGTALLRGIETPYSRADTLIQCPIIGAKYQCFNNWSKTESNMRRKLAAQSVKVAPLLIFTPRFVP